MLAAWRTWYWTGRSLISSIERSLLRIQLFTACQHGDVLLDALSAGLRSPRRGEPVEDREAVLGREDREHPLRWRRFRERSGEVIRHLGRCLASVRRCPTAVGLGALDLGNAGRMHAALARQ